MTPLGDWETLSAGLISYSKMTLAQIELILVGWGEKALKKFPALLLRSRAGVNTESVVVTTILSPFLL